VVPIGLFVSVPVASFRVPQAREYFETFPCPPPSTVYGMLLSLVGESDRYAHRGAEVALALLSRPLISIVLRSFWRIKDLNTGPGLGENKRPDYQELLTDVRLAIWVRPGAGEVAVPSLAERVADVIAFTRSPDRFGGLALGESTHLVDEVRPLRGGDLTGVIEVLQPEPTGDLALPVWPDHVGSLGTRWGQYQLVHIQQPITSPPEAWTAIDPGTGSDHESDTT
jgi:CRISPR-associated protein Cas5t